MNEKTNRIEYIDICKGIGIILVIIGHSHVVFNPLRQFIYCFHMPLFFLVSGVVWDYEVHKCRGFINMKFIKDKFYRLIIPCYFWGVVYLIINNILISDFRIIKILYLLYGNQSGFFHADSLTSLWFLPCMFISVCVFEIIQMKFNDKKIVIFIGIISAVIGVLLFHFPGGFPWSLDVSFLAVSFMIVGYYCKNLFNKVKSISHIFIVIILSFLVLFLTFQFNLSYISINNVDMAGRYLGNPFLYYIDAISGCVLVIMISKLVSYNWVLCKLFSYLGKITIPIFILHKPVIYVVEKLLNGFPTVFVVFCSVVISLMICIFLYHFLCGIVPFVFGEKNQRKS